MASQLQGHCSMLFSVMQEQAFCTLPSSFTSSLPTEFCQLDRGQGNWKTKRRGNLQPFPMCSLFCQHYISQGSLPYQQETVFCLQIFFSAPSEPSLTPLLKDNRTSQVAISSQRAEYQLYKISSSSF